MVYLNSGIPLFVFPETQNLMRISIKLLKKTPSMRKKALKYAIKHFWQCQSCCYTILASIADFKSHQDGGGKGLKIMNKNTLQWNKNKKITIFLKIGIQH